MGTLEKHIPERKAECMKVAIFIQTRTKRVGVLKEAKAKWVVECALKDGTVQSRDGIVSCENATESKAALTALRDALKRFTKAADIRLYIGDNYVRNMILNGNLTKWKNNGWQGSRGTIKMLDLWKEVSELMEMHLISSAYGLELDLKRLKKMEEELNGTRED